MNRLGAVSPERGPQRRNGSIVGVGKAGGVLNFMKKDGSDKLKPKPGG